MKYSVHYFLRIFVDSQSSKVAVTHPIRYQENFLISFIECNVLAERRILKQSRERQTTSCLRGKSYHVCVDPK